MVLTWSRRSGATYTADHAGIQGYSQEIPRPAADSEAMTATATATETHRVLVVDDEPNIVDVVSMALRFQGFGAPRRPARAGADHLPHGPRRDRRQDSRADDRRRRLRHQAVQPRGARRPDPLDPAAHRPRRARLQPPGVRGPRARRGRPRGPSRRRADRPHGDRVPAAALPDAQPRRVLTRAQLLEHVWQYDFGGDARVLETYVSYLRRKLDAHGPPLIHTVRGVGYALRRPRT